MPELSDRQQAEQEANRLPAALAASGAGALALASADVTIIDRPAAGQTRVVDLAGAKHLKFNFLQADFTVQVLDVDAVLTFADGGKLVMPAFVMQIVTADPPKLHFGNVLVDPQAVLASAGDIRMSEQLPQLALSENARLATKPEDQPKPVIVQLPNAQQFANTPTPSASARQSAVVGTGDGEALQDSNGRYARRVNVDEAQSSSLKGEGSLTERTNAVPVEAPAPAPVKADAVSPDPVEADPVEPDIPVIEPNFAPEITSQSGQTTASLQRDENTAAVSQVTATDADPNSNLIFAIVGGRDSARFSINSVDGQLYFIAAPDHESPQSAQADNDYEVIVQVSDGRDVDVQTLTIRVANVNEAPDDVTVTSSTVTENAINGTLVGRAAGADPDAGAVLSYSFAPGGNAGGRFAIDGSTGDITVIRGDLIDFEASQNQLVIVRVTDQAGLSFDRPVVLTITDANDPPVIASNGGGGSAAIAVAENLTAVTIVTATDTDIGSVLTYSIVGGVDAAQFTINAATGSLHFIGGRDFETPLDTNGDNIYQVVVQASDGLGGIDTQTLSVSVVNGNEIPDTLTLSNTSIAENSANGASVGFAVGTDPDPGAVLSYSFVAGGDAAGRFTIDSATGEVTVADGTRLDFENNPSHVIIVRVTDQGGLSLDRAFTINVTNVNEAPVITANGGGPAAMLSVTEGLAAFATMTATDPEGTAPIFSISGGADAARFAINAVTGALSFVTPPDFESPGDANLDNVYDIVVQVSDGALVDTQSLSITVTNQNEAPVITSNGGGNSVTIAINESQTSITTVMASDPDPLATLSYAIIGGADSSRFTINSVTGVLTLIAPPDFEAPTDAGGNNIYDVLVQASDGTLVDTQLISVSVTNQNDPPVITSNGGGATGTASVVENGGTATTVVATDADIGAVLTYTILGGADAARFTINSTTGVLSFIAPPNFEAPSDADGNNQYEVTVQVLDGGGGVDTQALTVTVTNQNEAPEITSNGGGATAGISMLEGFTAVTTVAATDPDAATTLTYSIIGGADAAKFAINSATGQLTFIVAPDYDIPGDADADNVYDVRVQASDGSLTSLQDIAVTITNINEAPTITSLGGGATGSVSAGENGTAVSTVVATDADAGNTLTYTITGGADSALFSINPTTGVLTFVSARNFEVPTDVGANNIYDVVVQVSDGLGGLDSQAIAVTVTDQNDAPVITSNGGGASAAISVAENTTAITTVTSTDPDLGATRTFSISGGVDASRFTINSSTGVLAFTANRNFESPIDVGANNVYDVVVQVSDSLGGTATQAIAVTVTNVNEAPVITSNGGGPSASISVSENQTSVTTVTSTDPDASPSRIFSIIGGADAAKFVIDASTGVLTFVAAPNFETPTDVGANNIYNVNIQVSDGLGGTDTQNIAVTVTNQNEAPAITSNGGGPTASITIAENGSAVTTVTATDPDTPSTLTYSLAGGADQALFTINATTGVLTFISAPNFDAPTDVGANNIYDVQVRVSDGALTATQSIAVTVTNVNEAPVISSNGGGPTAAINYMENVGAVPVTTVVAVDQDAATTLTYSIVGGADSAKFTINATTGVLAFVSNPDFETPTDVGANNVYDVVVQVSDGTLLDTQAIAISVTNDNDAPVITSNLGGPTAAISIAENGTAVTTVTATDIDAGAAQTYSISGGADQALFAINATTGVLTFIGAPNFEIPSDVGANNIYDVIVQVSDGLGGIDTQAIAVTVTNQNEAPVITSNGSGPTANINFGENGLAITTVTATDVDSGATQTYSITGGADMALFTINATTGVLSFIAPPNFEAPGDSNADNIYGVNVRVADGLGGFDDQNIFVTVTNQNEAPVITSNLGGPTAAISIAENSTAVTTVTATDVDAGATQTYSISGGADQALFTINASTGVLSFIGGPNFEAPGDAGANNVYDVIVQVSDGAGGTDTQAIAVTITDMNDRAPVITSDGGGNSAAISVAEGSTAVTSVTATDVDTVGTISYSISGGADQALFTINATTGVLTFIGAPNFEAPTDNGGNNVYDVVVRAFDGVSFDQQTLAVTVTNQNEAPVITSNLGGPTAAISVGENGTAVTTVTATDVDASATQTYSISGGADMALFTINATTGVLTFIGTPNFETPTDIGANNIYDVIVQVSDGLGGIDTQAIAVTVTDANEAPVITSDSGGPTAAISISENGTAVTTVTATDLDAGATQTYSISGGADQALFSINSTTGVLTFNGAPNFEAPGDVGADNVYDVVVQVSDGQGGVDTQALAVTVTNQNEAPVITSDLGGPTASITVAENATAVTTVTATDVDAGATQTYSLSGGADMALFTINATTGVLSFIGSPNFEAPGDAGADNVYDVIVQVSDGLGGIDTQAISVTLTNQNEAPVITSNLGGPNAAISMAENGTAVTTVTATDVDASATQTYSITGGADMALFTINATTGVLTFNGTPNFEAPGDVGANNVYDVIVQVSDGLGGVDTQAIAVTVTDANDAPVFTSTLGGPTAAFSVGDNGTAVTTVTATDVDASATQTYSISGGADQALFAINATTGVLTFIGAPNFEAPGDAGTDNIYDVIVQVSDGLGGIDTQAIAVTVTDANDIAPTITSNLGGPTAAISIAENGTAVTTVTANDADTVGTISYSISGGADMALFTINATTGVLTFIGAPNFEAPGDAGANNVYDVIVRASDGVQFDDQAIAVTIADQNDVAPVINTNGAGATAAVSLAENTTAVTTVAATDQDTIGSVTYSITGGADMALFTINAATGVLTFIGAPNFEAPGDAGADNVYDVTVRASDGVQFDEQAIAVTVTDANDIAPTITSNLGGPTAAINIAENGTAVTTVTANDADTVGTISYSISGGADMALFTINAATGVLTFIGAPDFEVPGDAGANNVYDVIVRASDGVQFDDQAVAITVTDAVAGFAFTGGNDSYTTPGENLLADGLAGNDTINGAGLADTINGGDDDDIIDGAAGNDLIDADDGNDTILGGAGADTIAGDDGVDFLNYFNDTVGVTVNLQTNAASGGDAQGDVISDIEWLQGGSGADNLTGTTSANLLRGHYGADTISGLDGDDTISGDLVTEDVLDGADLIDAGAGADEVYGRGGNDTVTGGTGNDTIDGGSGTDRVVFTGNRADYTITESAGTYTISHSLGSMTDGADSVSNVEEFQFADGVIGIANVTDITGTAGNNSLAGTADANVLLGLAGSDTLSGAGGNDRLDGGDNNDQIDGGTGNDTLLGGTGFNTLHGDDGNDRIDAQSGTGSYYGDADNDYIISGALGTFMRGGTGDDTISWENSSAGVNISLIGNSWSGGDAAGDNVGDFEVYVGSAFNDTMVGAGGSEKLTGGLGADSLNGWTGDDTLEGGAGNDTLIGGGGNDVLLGGVGNDAFYIDASALIVPATDIQGGADVDSVTISTGAALTLADIVGSVSQVESIDFSQAGVAANLTNFNGAAALSILGTSAPTGNVLTIDLDGNDTFSALTDAAHTANDLGGGVYQYVDNVTLQEVARVSVI